MAISRSQADQWEVLNPLLDAMYVEIKDLSKKKPDAPVSGGKIKMINRLLESCRTVLEGEASLEFLDLLEPDEIPEASDVAIVLSQYKAAFDQFHSQHHGYDPIQHEHTWRVSR